MGPWDQEPQSGLCLDRFGQGESGCLPGWEETVGVQEVREIKGSRKWGSWERPTGKPCPLPCCQRHGEWVTQSGCSINTGWLGRWIEGWWPWHRYMSPVTMSLLPAWAPQISTLCLQWPENSTKGDHGSPALLGSWTQHAFWRVTIFNDQWQQHRDQTAKDWLIPLVVLCAEPWDEAGAFFSVFCLVEQTGLNTSEILHWVEWVVLSSAKGRWAYQEKKWEIRAIGGGLEWKDPLVSVSNGWHFLPL